MDEELPWLKKWHITKSLSHGGQGTTHIVAARDSELAPQAGVLKILKDQASAEARRRMFREVTNLIVLHNAGCRVPKVLDSNVDRFEVAGEQLYFVMEFIDGVTLATFVNERNGLTVDKSSRIVLELCDTITVAQKEDILHRDLKPENIIISEIEGREPTVIIVDYGLSFNSRSDDNLTRISETLDNSFLSLPERRIPGGNRRDPRSDITGLCGILYFCITNHAPVDLVGPDNQPPHRRPKHSIREKMGEGITTQLLESFFDCGFSPNIESRFQTPDAFAIRLKELLNPAIQRPKESPITIAERASNFLRKQNRKTQLAQYCERVADFNNQMIKHWHKYRGKLESFGVFDVRLHPHTLWRVDGYDEMNTHFDVGIRETHHDEYYMVIAYQILSQATQCAVFRGVFLATKGSQIHTEVNPWQPILRYEGIEKPDMDSIKQDFDAILGNCIDEIQRRILSGS